MKFIQENLFLVVLVGVTVVLGGALIALGITTAGERDEMISQRREVLEEIANHREKAPVKPEIIEAEEVRVRRAQETAQNLRNRAVEANRRGREVLQATLGDRTITAFPYDRDLMMNQGGGFAVSQAYQAELRKLIDELDATQPPTAAEVEGQVRAWANNLERKYRARALEEAERQQDGTGESTTDSSRRSPRSGGGGRSRYEYDEGEYGEGDYYGEGGGYEYGGSSRSRERDQLGGVELSNEMERQLEQEAEEMGVASAKARGARRGLVYADPNSLFRVPPMTVEQADAPDLWRAQYTLWIQQDIVDAIQNTNQAVYGQKRRQQANFSPRGVIDSAVKRLVSVEFDPTYVVGPEDADDDRGGRSRGGPPSRGGPRRYAEEEYGYGEEDYGYGEGGYYGEGRGSGGGSRSRDDDDSSAAARGEDSLTGRVSNEAYDVLRYRVTLVISQKHLPLLQRELQKQPFHTVLRQTMRRVGQGQDRGEPSREDWYYYGGDGVVEVTLECEAAFLTDWVRGKWVADERGEGHWSDEYPPLTPNIVLRNQLSSVLREEDEDRLEAAEEQRNGDTYGRR
ncbi:MAG: hypothetical protein ACOC93_03115 [Planctomycetota bacterium]